MTVPGPIPQNRRWLVAQSPVGRSVEGIFRWEDGVVPVAGPGQMLVRNLWLSIDPTCILALPEYASERGPSGAPPPMQSLAVSRVIDSNLPAFRPGDLVHGASGWEDYSTVDGTGFYPTWKVPEGATPAEALGVFGATGLAAFFGMVEVGKPAAGETVVVSGAAGGVGSIATQIARLRGARVVGIAGGPAKCAWLTGVARLDAAIDHRAENVAERLDALCPDGIDLYFDNVGGSLADLAMARLRPHGRIVVCGATSEYGADPGPPGPSSYFPLTYVQGRIDGLLTRAYIDRYPEAVATLRGWIRSGELRTLEDVADGLEAAPSALARLLRGENLGKQLVRIADP